MSDVLLRIRDLSFSYEPARPVLQGASLELRSGDRVALTGPNGAGKSTLLRLITGLLRPASGEIEVFEIIRKEERDFREVRSRVGLLFQDSDDQLFCPTVFEDVAFGPLNLGMTRDETGAAVKRTLELLGLSDYENRITYRLSAGEKRLVSLATVLSMRPEILLLDEPTAGLDEHAVRRVAETLMDSPLSMLVVSQDRAFLSRVTGRSVCLRNGRITRDGDPTSNETPDALATPPR